MHFWLSKCAFLFCTSYFQFLMNKLLILTFHSITTPFDAFEIPGFENIMENGAFAYKEQMLHFP